MEKNTQPSFWIRDPDSRGNPVDRRLIDAADRVWERARLTVLRYLADDAETPEILEAAVDSASRALGNQRSIRFFEAYLIRSVAREAIRRNRNTRRIAYVDAAALDRFAMPICIDLDRKLDNAKRVQVIAACMDGQGRMMFDLRVLGFGWKYIANLTGYSDAHSAEVQFRKKLDKALIRFRTYHQLQSKPERGK